MGLRSAKQEVVGIVDEDSMSRRVLDCLGCGERVEDAWAFSGDKLSRDRERLDSEKVGFVIEEGTDRYLVSLVDDIGKIFILRLVLVRKRLGRR